MDRYLNREGMRALLAKLGIGSGGGSGSGSGGGSSDLPLTVANGKLCITYDEEEES